MFLIILFKAHNTVSSFLLYANTFLIALAETWLTKDISAQVNIEDYKFFSCVRPYDSGYGGVVLRPYDLGYDFL